MPPPSMENYIEQIYLLVKTKGLLVFQISQKILASIDRIIDLVQFFQEDKQRIQDLKEIQRNNTRVE